MEPTTKSSILTTINQASAAMGETNDCTVRALAIAGAVAYQEAHAAMKAAGRRDRHGPKAFGRLEQGVRRIDCPAITKAARALGIDIRRMEKHEYRAKTVSSAPRDPKLQAGHYIVLVRGHALAVVQGEVCDWTEGRKHQVKEVYELKPRQQAAQPAIVPAPRPIPRMSAFVQGRLF